MKFDRSILLPILLILFVGVLSSSCSAGSSDTVIPIQETSAPPTDAPPTAVIVIEPNTSETQTDPSSDAPAPTSLNDSGPYVYYESEDRFWISNPDGSYLTLIAENIDRNINKTVFSPDEKSLVALINDGENFNLMEFSIPEGIPHHIDLLISLTEADKLNATGDKAIASYAVRKYPNSAWQPGEGRYIAYAGARVGPTSDLYVHDRETRENTQLSDGPAQTIKPIWSPNGQYILSYGVSWVPPFGGAIVGFNQIDGSWATRLSDEEIITQPEPQRINFVGWLNNTEYITFDADASATGGCDAGVFKAVNPANRQSRLLSDYCYQGSMNYSQENGTILLENEADCPCSPGNGLFFLSTENFDPIYIMTADIWGIHWMPENNAFWAYSEVLVSGDGSKLYYPPPVRDTFEPALSKAGYQAWKIYQDGDPAVVLKAGEGDWQTIMTDKVNQLIWDPLTGETLLIILDNGTMYRATAPDFAPEEIVSFGANIQETGWIQTSP